MRRAAAFLRLRMTNSVVATLTPVKFAEKNA
jgi:hypothetical protein